MWSVYIFYRWRNWVSGILRHLLEVILALISAYLKPALDHLNTTKTKLKVHSPDSVFSSGIFSTKHLDLQARVWRIIFNQTLPHPSNSLCNLVYLTSSSYTLVQKTPNKKLLTSWGRTDMLSNGIDKHQCASEERSKIMLDLNWRHKRKSCSVRSAL